MKSRSPEIEYHCVDDCLQAGCPGHRIKAVYDHSTDMVFFEIQTRDKTEIEVFDENRLKAMMEAYGKIKW